MDQTTLAKAQHVHLTGIKGVGMTALALCLQDMGKSISGSDVEADFVTKDALQQRNITPQTGFDVDAIPPQTSLLIYTGAHHGIQNPQVIGAQQKGIDVISHAQATGILLDSKIGVSVCGVGGKTTTSAMLTTILDYAGKKPSFIIGVGKVLNLQVPGRYTEGEHFIAEADEYVVSPGSDATPRFMFQHPQVTICTNVMHDHPDQYETIEQTKQAFRNFFNQIKSGGVLIANADSPALAEIISQNLNCQIITYAAKSQAQWQITGNYMGQGKQMVTFIHEGQEFNMALIVPGLFNAKNALAAYIAARQLGIDHQTALEGVQLFRGSMRRFEKVGEANHVLHYDDYAHHPKQIQATLEAAQQWLPLNRIVVVFQPHTYSRTKVLFDDFVQSFKFANSVIITDIYASAREAVDDSVSGYSLAEAVSKQHPDAKFVPHADLVSYLQKHLQPGDALFTLGAGDIYQIHQSLLASSQSQ